MSKIKIFSLGGLNENGKNMYVVDVDESIFIFDAGLKYASESYLGVDYIVPSFSFIKENLSKIKGIFITHAHENNYGAVIDIVKEIPKIKIYGTRLTIEILKRELELEKLNFTNYEEIIQHKQIKFDKVSVFPLSLTHSIPDTVGYVVNTDDGAIFYTGDYLFDQSMMGNYKTDIGKLAYVGKKGVLCMLGSSVYSAREGYTAPNHRITKSLKDIFTKAEDRIIFTVFESDIYRIQELFNQITLNKRKVVVMGKALSHIINKAIDLGYIDFDKKLIGNLQNLNDKDVVVLTSNGRQRPYSTIERIINGYDKFIKLKSTDTVILGEAPGMGHEKKSAAVMDGIARKDAECVDMSSKEYLLTNASSEDIMLMLNLMNPKYYMPVGSEYRYQYHNSLVAKKYGMKDENIILAKNGDVIEFIDGVLKPTATSVPADEMLIDGNSVEDVGALVLKDREILSKDGIVIVTATIDKKSKSIIAGPEILSRGFIYVKENVDIIEESKKISKEIIIEHKQKNFIDYNKVKMKIREKLGKYLYNETKCKPMIITVISEI